MYCTQYREARLLTGQAGNELQGKTFGTVTNYMHVDIIFTHFKTCISPFVTRSDKFGQQHVAGQSDSPTLLLPHISE